MKTIYVVSHTESEHHLSELVGGWYDSELTVKGIADANAIGEILNSEGEIEAIISSDLKRASTTAYLQMTQFIDNVLERIETGSLLPASYYATIDVELSLNARDNHPTFSIEWNNLFKNIENAWECSAQPESIKTKLYTIQKSSFLLVSKATSQSELASYVSDDLDLITKAKILGVSHHFLESLWSSYESGEFPYPKNLQIT